MDESMQALVAKIAQAFADPTYPGDEDLADNLYGDEPEALAKAFRGKTNWRNLDTGFLSQAPDGWGSALSLFTGEAILFYLPAYLIADISRIRLGPTSMCYMVYLSTDCDDDLSRQTSDLVGFELKRPAGEMLVLPGDPGCKPVTRISGVPWWPAGIARPTCAHGHHLSFMGKSFMRGE